MTLMPEQFVLDCAWSNKSNACDGGLSDDGADTILQKFGGKVPSAASYGHYLSVDGYCKDVSSMPAAATLTGYKFVAARDEGAVLDALLSVARCPSASTLTWTSFCFTIRESSTRP